MLPKRMQGIFSLLASTGMPLVGIEPSIILTYRDEYPAILKKDKVNFSVLLPQEFMEQDLQRLREHAPESRRAFRLLGHCMEKTGALLSQKQWISVFEGLGQELKVLETGCCGMAGTYGHETSHLAESRGIYKMSWGKRVAEVPEKQQRLLVTGFSCRSQLERFEGFRPLHPIQAL